MDFLDWFSAGVDYVGELFSAAGDGAGDYLTKLFTTDSPSPELLGGDTPVSEYPTPEVTNPATPEIPSSPESGNITVDSLIKQFSEMSPEMKKKVEAMWNNKELMGGIAGGANAWLKNNAANKMLKSQKGMQDDDQEFKTETQKRRGQVGPIAQVRPRGLTEGYLKG